jgi:hypothetical protein
MDPLQLRDAHRSLIALSTSPGVTDAFAFALSKSHLLYQF